MWNTSGLGQGCEGYPGHCSPPSHIVRGMHFHREGTRDNTNLPQNLSRSPRKARENPGHGKSSSAHPQSYPVLKGLQSGSMTLRCSLKLVQYKTHRAGVRTCLTCVCMDAEAGYNLPQMLCHSSDIGPFCKKKMLAGQ